MLRRAFIVVGLMAALAACAGPAPERAALSPDLAQTLSVQDVEVTMGFTGVTSGREVPAEVVKEAVEKQKAGLLVKRGPRQTKALLNVTNTHIITAGQSILIGGESIMSGTVSLMDAETGEVIVPPVEISSGGGGWTPGGIIGAATMDDRNVEVQQMAAILVQRARMALF